MAAPISKQERIRLNQQRSRARKQEYVQDLEKRVHECHITCREATLQRETFQQLQKENLKLRTLLGSLGVGELQVESYVNSDASETSTEQTPLRHLRPKLQSEMAPARGALLAHIDGVTDNSTPSMPAPMPSTVVSSTSSSCCTSACASARPEVDDPCMSSTTTLEIPPSGYCDTFLNYFEPTLQATLENSMSCLEARDLIDQYNISGQDIRHISFRLAAGFSPETIPGEGCRVDKRLLFEVLNEISSNLS